MGITWEKTTRGPVAEYEVDLNGFTTTMRLNEADAKRLKARPVARHKARSPEDAQDKSAVDLWSLTNRQLAELVAERGLEIPSRATKAQLVALLEG